MEYTQSKLVLELLSKALEFYAKDENYETVPTDDDTDSFALLPSEVERDRGRVAKETLHNIREIMGKEEKHG